MATLDTYLQMIERYVRASQRWRTQAEKIDALYLRQRRRRPDERRFAILWANMRTMQPAVYARPPQIVVARRFKSADPEARKAADVLEAALNTAFDLYDLDEVLQAVRDDLLLAGRGTAFVRYEAVIEQDRVQSERICADYVHWSDFGHTVARRWRDVNQVWRCVYLSREKVIDRFGAAKANQLRYEYRPEYAQKYGVTEPEAVEPLTRVYELWDREARQTLWFSREQEILLDQGPPPLDLRKFFPCPRPAYATISTTSLFPVPDYVYYQDQAEEIDDLTDKIASLTYWLRVLAFLPSGPSRDGAAAIEQALKIEGNNVFVPVPNWAGFVEGGGSAQIQWFPIQQVVVALREAINARRELKNDVFELTGLSDIIRGASDPNETLGAQEIKTQTSQRRISSAQREMARFARELAEIAGEVMADLFQPETLSAMSGIDLSAAPPPELLAMLQRLEQAAAAGGNDPALMSQLQEARNRLQTYQQNAGVIRLLRDDRIRPFRIDIETDSTLLPDENAEKQARIEFLTAVGGFMREALPVLQNVPDLAPVMKEMLLFLVRGFRVGRSIEEVIERQLDQLEAGLMRRSAEPQPNIEAEKLKLEAENSRAELQLRQQEIDGKLQLEREKLAAERELKLLAVQQKAVPAAQIEMKHNTEAIAGPIAEVVARLGEALSAQQTAQTEAIVGAFAHLAAALSAPKRVVRDREGRVIGAETVQAH